MGYKEDAQKRLDEVGSKEEPQPEIPDSEPEQTETGHFQTPVRHRTTEVEEEAPPPAEKSTSKPK